MGRVRQSLVPTFVQQHEETLMDLRKRSATTVYAVLAAVVLAVPVMAQSPEGVDLAARATIKQDALVRVVEALKESAVRPVEEHRVLADAKRIVAALRADQIEALAAGEEWAEVNAMQPEATASADGGARAAPPRGGRPRRPRTGVCVR